MDNLKLPKDKLPEMLKEIAEKFTLVGPKEETGFTEFQELDNPEDTNLDYLLSRVPPKTLVFQQTETLFTFTKGKNAKVETPKVDPGKRIVFGIRPCDARGYSLINPVFDGQKEGDYKDPFYILKRNRSTLIGLSCLEPDVNCFCTSFGDSPANTEFLDLLFTDIGDAFYIDVITKKGEELINSLSKMFSKATEEDKSSRDGIEEASKNKILRHMKTEGAQEKLGKMFNHEYWEEVSRRCIGCGICTYLCPTCHCFDIQDESTLKEGGRIRIWDSCMNPEYTHHASGHNPRPSRMNRVRNRVFHKFNYFPKNDGVYGCTGCGRCIDYCPVNIDIIDIIDEVKEIEL